MSDWIYGFFMAWGMFLTIPCPKKIWRESARRKMLACLPLIGLIVGGIWALCAWLGSFLPQPLAALLCAAAPWLITGFMHLDGYMDVCDAVLSRRDLETRQRILKDSHCGAFAVICLALLVLCQWAVFLSAEALPLWPLTLIPAASRACAALAVLTLRPMSSSQYSAMTRGGQWHWSWLRPLCWRRCAGSPHCCGTALLRWLRRCAIGWRHGTLSGSWMVCPAMCQASP